MNDVISAADAITRFVADSNAVEYAENELLHSAVERKFAIIGEALSQLAKAEPEVARRIADLREVIGFRNILIHGYVLVEHHFVWRVIVEALPGLRAEIADMLNSWPAK